MQIVRIGETDPAQCTPELIGAKAAQLARMTALGIAVPPAFVLPVDLCGAILSGDPEAKRQLADGLAEGIAWLEKATGKRFGDARDPLLVSVRSGAARSMPGMLDTVLDVGCTTKAARGLIRMSGNPRFAWDCRCRFLESFSDVVLGLDPAPLAAAARDLASAEGAGDASLLDPEALERLAGLYLQLIDDRSETVSDDPMAQLRLAARAVYRSWGSERAQTYRKLQHLEDLRGTAVTVQAMVYGNRGRTSGAGVAFSRDPSGGENRPVIDVLFEAQGEDVVSGRRNPETEAAIAHLAPEAAAQLSGVLRRLEDEFADVQDVEFTIENGRLWILQTRPAKRTPQAALRFAVDFVRGGKISEAEALRRLDGVDLDTLAMKHLFVDSPPIGKGTGASGGIAVGRAAFDTAAADRLAGGGEPVILMRPDTSTSDIAGFHCADGIVTATGGRTAHAALVARQMGKPCIVGCAGLTFGANGCTLSGSPIREGEWLSIDAGSGLIYRGRGSITVERPAAELAAVEGWRGKPLSAHAEGCERSHVDKV